MNSSSAYGQSLPQPLSLDGFALRFTALADLMQSSRQDHRFKLILTVLLALYLVAALVVPMLEQVELPREQQEQVPPQLAKVILEQKVIEKPKPKPEPKPEIEPEPEPKPEIEADTPPPQLPVPPSATATAKEQAQNAGLAAMKDDLLAMRDSFELEPSSNLKQSNDNAEAATIKRDLIGASAELSAAELGQAAITQTVNNAGLEAAAGDKQTRQIRLAEREILASAGANAERQQQASSNGKRSEASLRRTLEANKSRLYALYNRALRKDPLLQGRVLFEIEIAANGSISNVAIKSTGLNNPKLERQLTLVLKSIKFPAEQVDTMVTQWAIDFLPS
ncbi:AgmX/PglI C-terminal domain-containing protein [Ferrimonas senticii]|uniref:AgmX/PglI C-terminal domain-containing protein n=1 Tax=Ferrimonas senticii TaxID=394566 RepID=UPI0004141E69|nr:AgmX/PglI C-terminal domain-containing protein [Ferrimonas senticii]